MRKRGMLVWEKLIPWIIALIVVIIILVLFVLLNVKGGEGINYVKEFFRFGS